MKKSLFLIAGACLYIGAFLTIALLYWLIPADTTFPVLLIVAPAIPMLWLGTVCLKRGGAPPGVLFRMK
jgi:hypothetical protein